MSIAEKVATLMANQPTYADQRIAELEAYNATRTDELVAAAGRIATLEQRFGELLAAAENLVRVKGRHHTEQAYKALETAIAKERP